MSKNSQKSYAFHQKVILTYHYTVALDEERARCDTAVTQLRKSLVAIAEAQGDADNAYRMAYMAQSDKETVCYNSFSVLFWENSG